jgi:hypothetical protein
MQGYLRKFVQKVKFFQKTVHPKRYWVIDFQTAIMTIQKEKEDKHQSENKKILFRDILDCYLPKTDIEDQLPKNWEHAIYLQTRDRLFVLCARTEEDRNMWMAGFRYLLASTLTVQSIMKDNNERLEHKMKVVT